MIILIVKTVENIERVKFPGYDPVGKSGTVTVSLSRRATGSVRVDGLDWSAKSKEDLKIGEEVLVVSRDGLHVFVKRFDGHFPNPEV